MMTALYTVNIFMAVFGFINYKKYIRGKRAKPVKVTVALLFFLTLITLYLAVHNYRFRGDYSNLIIGTAFLCSLTILYAVSSSVQVKYACVIFLSPVLMIDIGFIGPNPLLLPAIVPAMLMESPELKIVIDANHDLIARGGFMGPRPLYITKPVAVFFNKEQRLISAHWFSGYDNIQHVRLLPEDTVLVSYKNSDAVSLTDTFYIR